MRTLMQVNTSEERESNNTVTITAPRCRENIYNQRLVQLNY